MFYTLEPEKKYESMWIDLVDLKSLDGKELKEPSTSHGAPHIPEKSFSFQGMIEYYFSEESGSSFSRFNDGEEDKVYEDGINIKDLHSVTGPISLEISYYPTWIVGSEKIKIK